MEVARCLGLCVIAGTVQLFGCCVKVDEIVEEIVLDLQISIRIRQSKLCSTAFLLGLMPVWFCLFV